MPTGSPSIAYRAKINKHSPTINDTVGEKNRFENVAPLTWTELPNLPLASVSTMKEGDHDG